MNAPIPNTEPITDNLPTLLKAQGSVVEVSGTQLTLRLKKTKPKQWDH